MISLRAGDAEATLLPEQGGFFARLAQGGHDLIVPLPDGADPNRGPWGAFLMAPWTNRLDGGRIVVAGAEHRMAVNRPEENTAIHGFVREQPWRVVSATDDSAELSCEFFRTPFAGTARMGVRLSPTSLALSLAMRNTGDVPTPMGFGWHPWFPRPDGTRLRIAAHTVFGRDARGLPIAPRPGTGLNGSDSVLLGLDTHFAGWDGSADIAWPDGRALTLRAEGAWAANLQVYAPRGGTTLCVEPVTHAPDSPNRPQSALHGPMHLVAPGATLEAALTLRWG